MQMCYEPHYIAQLHHADSYAPTPTGYLLAARKSYSTVVALSIAIFVRQFVSSRTYRVPRTHFMQQLLERHNRDCVFPTGGTEHKPILYPSGFQCTISSPAARRSMLAFTSETTTSPLTNKPHAKNLDPLHDWDDEDGQVLRQGPTRKVAGRIFFCRTANICRWRTANTPSSHQPGVCLHEHI